jgi:DNA-binding LacI/PurR family transcriptional regulator
MEKVSIKDIAKTAGVSHSTVSRALADNPLVNAETKERIQHLAREMGYSPNAQARGLVTGRTYTVGVVVTTIADPFVAEVVQGIESTAHDNAYTVILASSNGESEREMAVVEMLRSKRVDGVIVTASRIGALYLGHVERIGVPVVLINNHNEQSGHYTYTVTVDNRHGSHLATEHLIRLGHRRIAYVSGPADHSSDTDRMAGYQQALKEHGIAFDRALIVPGDGKSALGMRALESIISMPHPPSAVFCYNDMTAIGILRAARQADVQVPGDLAVVGFDDIPFASYVYPPLTTIVQPKVEMGRLAMDMLLRLMAIDDPRNAQLTDIVVKGRLVVRESTQGWRPFETSQLESQSGER